MDYIYFELETTGSSPLYSQISRLRALRFCDARAFGANAVSLLSPVCGYYIFDESAISLPDEQKILKDFSAFAAGCNNIAYMSEASLEYLRDCLSQYAFSDFTAGWQNCEPDVNIPLEDYTEPFEAELKLFFDNYKDYFYLPYEDTAVHKSVGQFVDPTARIKATKQTAYVKKRGTFINAPRISKVTLFQKDYKDKNRYCLLNEADAQIKLHSLLVYISHFPPHSPQV